MYQCMLKLILQRTITGNYVAKDIFKSQRCLGIITARSGSKGVPNKNIRDLCGKPLINYAVEVGLGCPYIETVMVTTDDKEIETLAKKAGAEVPFLRPSNLALDSSRQEDAIFHTMDWYEKNREKYDFICLLQPTEPLRSITTVNKAFEILFDSEADGIMSVIKTEANPTNSNLLPNNGTFKGFINKEQYVFNRQEAPNYYRLNGLIAISRWESFRKFSTFAHDKALTMIVDSVEGLDIDNPVDFILAETLIQRNILNTGEIFNYLK